MIPSLGLIILGVLLGGVAHYLPAFRQKSLSTVVLLGLAGSTGGYLFAVFLELPSTYGLIEFVGLSAAGAVVALAIYWRIGRERLMQPLSGTAINKNPFGSLSVPQSGDIFLSYASKDRQIARDLACALEEYAWSIWWDRAIPPGKTFDEVIESALNGTKCVIVLWSQTSVASEWVKNEAREGMRRQILIPALIDNVTIPFEFRHIQAADLTGWPGPKDVGFQSLVSSLSAMLGTPKSVKSAPVKQ